MSAASRITEFGMTRHITEAAVDTAMVPLVVTAMDQLRDEFERLKAERGWPDKATPRWDIRWYYMEYSEKDDE